MAPFFIIIILLHYSPQIRLGLHSSQLHLTDLSSFIGDVNLERLQRLVPVLSPQPRRASKAIDGFLWKVVGVLVKEASVHKERWWTHQEQLLIFFLFHLGIQEGGLDVQDTSFPLMD